MRIKSFEVTGLLGQDSAIKLPFNPDLNIITGRNGSGKTTLLKLLWYIMSGNILLALKEINFRKATLETDAYTCTVHKLSGSTCRIDWHTEEGSQTFEDLEDPEGDTFFNAEDGANEILVRTGSSVFFPTFRRIEGGFTMGERANPLARAKENIEESLFQIARRLTNNEHVFVTALSTADVVTLLVKKYTDLSEQYNELQQEVSQQIISKIKAFKRDVADTQDLGAANAILDSIRSEIEGMEFSRETIMKPIEAVRGLVLKLFRHVGIKLSKTLSFGDAAGAIGSDALSAGEKQMLSFIAYNAFYSDAVILIDEPELSLHVDWQRQLFPILLDQQASNQFVIATHSPFIYTKYPEKELQMDPQRGDETE
jgi:predicted ATP-binding protein involved in virulence